MMDGTIYGTIVKKKIAAQKNTRFRQGKVFCRKRAGRLMATHKTVMKRLRFRHTADEALVCRECVSAPALSQDIQGPGGKVKRRVAHVGKEGQLP